MATVRKVLISEQTSNPNSPQNSQILSRQIRLKIASLMRLVALPFLQFASISKQGGTNHRNTGYTSVPRSSKGYSHTYSTWIPLSRLQRIYRLRHLTLGVVGSSRLSIGNQLMKSDRVYFFSRNSEERWDSIA